MSLEDRSVRELKSDIEPNWNNSIGIDLGLEKIVSTSAGEFISPPKFFRKSSENLAILQQKAETRKKKSRARKLLYKKVAKLHQKIARQRQQFHFETARDLLKQYDVIFVEDLDLKNMSKRNKPKTDEQGKFLPNKQAQKSGMNKSFGDAGLGQFIEILMYKAEKASAKVIQVNPRGTSQYCSNCLNKVAKTLSDRWHSCPCGCELDRDTNAAILIKKVGLGIASLKNARKSKLDLEKPAT
nr:transposase [Pleurocapsa sp. PCC 7327]